MSLQVALLGNHRCRRRTKMSSDDPMERLIRDALQVSGVRFIEGDKNGVGLDFHLPEHDFFIEVKQFHSDRISRQMKRADNVIVAQGRGAVEALARMIATGAWRER